MTAPPSAPFVLLAGVPGAGKTQALNEIRRKVPEIRISDPETVRSVLGRCVPWLPYALGRPFVHTTAHIGALGQILRPENGPLIVHDPGTRRWSRRLILRLTLLKGYHPIVVYLDTDRATALQGQVQRKRVVRNQAFDRHWRRWLELRNCILTEVELSPGEQWPQIVLSSRDSVVDDVLKLLSLDQREQTNHPAQN